MSDRNLLYFSLHQVVFYLKHYRAARQTWDVSKQHRMLEEARLFLIDAQALGPDNLSTRRISRIYAQCCVDHDHLFTWLTWA